MRMPAAMLLAVLALYGQGQLRRGPSPPEPVPAKTEKPPKAPDAPKAPKARKAPEAPTAQDRLVGTWKLVSFEDRRPTGEVTHPHGRDPLGVIMYDGAGHMAAQIMNHGRPDFADRRQPTPEEKKAAYETYIAYFGSYTVNESEGTVTHHVEGGLSPNMVGSDLKRSFEFSGDRLILKPVGQTGVLTWERVK